jgi:DNA polymerase III alpha subunit (gram-positive type)
MYVLGVDIETTGLSPDNDNIIELGAVVWDTEVDKPIAMMNHLIAIGDKKLSNKIITLTGITDIDLDSFGIGEKVALTELLKLAEKCDYIVAHNGNKFDRLFIDNALNKYDISLDKPWIDTVYDVPYHEGIKSKKLTDLAIHYNCSTNYAHRALFDVLMMLDICSYYDWQDIIELQKIPMITIVANVSYEELEKAKSEGFYFDRNTKQWKTNMKESKLDSLSYNFEYTICS